VSPTSASQILTLASHALEGEIKEARGDLAGAIAAYTRAVEIEDSNSYTEPPDWSQSMRLYLGAAQLEAGMTAEAEATFREDLQWKQQSGWSTFGLYQAIEAQGRSAEAEIVKRQFDSFWRNADVTLTRARL
jgi:tetratricopeptide (TPR) repeat protein